MNDPEPPLVPVMPPVIGPTVHVYVLATEAVRLIFVPVPLQMAVVLAVVITGAGLTVTVIGYIAPAHKHSTVAVGVTR
jgi:hypothetical protein